MSPAVKTASLRCNLAEIVKKHGVTVNKLSQDIDGNRELLQRLYHNKEMNKRRIPVELAARICTYFGITMDQLFTLVYDEDLA